MNRSNKNRLQRLEERTKKSYLILLHDDGTLNELPLPKDRWTLEDAKSDHNYYHSIDDFCKAKKTTKDQVVISPRWKAA